MPDLITGLIRTIATLAVGATLTALANLARRELGVEVHIDDAGKATIISGVTAFVSMLWYAVFATLERKWPAFGIFLGWPKAPHYDTSTTARAGDQGPTDRVDQADEPDHPGTALARVDAVEEHHQWIRTTRTTEGGSVGPGTA